MRRKTLAIPMRCNDFSNSSQIVSLFTREAGLVEGLAKGAHRRKNPFQGPFDLAVVYELIYLERHSGLVLLTESTVVDGLRGLRRSWPRFLAASHLLEFLRVVATAGEPSEALFDLAYGTLAELADGRADAIELALARFDMQALRVLGLFSPLASCVRCRRPWSQSGRRVFLSISAGGLVCGHCRRTQSFTGLLLPGAAVRSLNRLSEPPGLPGARSMASGEPLPAVDPGLRGLIATLRTNLLERELVLLKSTARWV